MTERTSPKRISPSEASGVRRQAREVRSATAVAGAAAPSLGASTVVGAYVRAAKEAGNDRFCDSQSKAIIGARAKRLLADYPIEVVVSAVMRFAKSNRNPAFLGEWVRIEDADLRAEEWEKFKAQDKRDAPGTMRAIGRAIKEMGL